MMMGDEEDGHAALADRLDEVPRLAACLRVEARGQLIEDRDLRFADEREGNREALLLAAGQIPILRVALRGQPEVVDEGFRILGIGVEGREQLDGLGDRHAVGELALLELDADECPQAIAIVLRIEPENPDRAGVRPAQSGDRLDRRRLSRAVRPEDSEDLPLFDAEGDAVDSRSAVVALGDVGDFDDVHAPRMALAPS